MAKRASAKRTEPSFVVVTDFGIHNIVATKAERMGEFYAFFDEDGDTRMVRASLFTRLLGGPSEVAVSSPNRRYVQLVRFRDIQNIIVPQVSA